MNTLAYVQTIIDATNKRFDAETESDVISKILSVGGEDFHHKSVIRLRRASSEKSGFRTMLIAEIVSNQLTLASRWAANVRDILAEPEISDLYLIIVSSDITSEQAMKAEADEQFCRKFVSRPDEGFSELLERTFLSSISFDERKNVLTDPLDLAFEKTRLVNPWFSEDASDDWKREFLSGKTGRDLVEAIIESEGIKKGEDNAP
jgi:predicted Mrr-cat superfamily restriction endonuclease